MQSGVLTYRGNNRDISAIIQKLADMKTISKESRKAIDFLREKEIKPFESKVKSLGFKYFVCRSFEEFQRIVKAELNL